MEELLRMSAGLASLGDKLVFPFMSLVNMHLMRKVKLAHNKG